jgi:hypothetical protein
LTKRKKIEWEVEFNFVFCLTFSGDRLPPHFFEKKDLDKRIPRPGVAILKLSKKQKPTLCNYGVMG